jgi:hypothetical protein
MESPTGNTFPANSPEIPTICAAFSDTMNWRKVGRAPSTVRDGSRQRKMRQATLPVIGR